MKKDGGNMTIDRVCTIGPASNNKETLAKLINNGMKNCSSKIYHMVRMKVIKILFV